MQESRVRIQPEWPVIFPRRSGKALSTQCLLHRERVNPKSNIPLLSTNKYCQNSLIHTCLDALRKRTLLSPFFCFGTCMHSLLIASCLVSRVMSGSIVGSRQLYISLVPCLHLCTFVPCTFVHVLYTRLSIDLSQSVQRLVPPTLPNMEVNPDLP
jgi:hypothetical protein